MTATRIATLVAAIVLAAVGTLLGPAEAHADEADAQRLTACRVDGRTVTLTTADGRTIVRDSVAITTVLANVSEGLRKRPTRTGRVITACRTYAVGDDTRTVIRTIGRARYRLTNVRVRAAIHARATVPNEARPAVTARWATPVTVYAPVSADWQVDAVLAAWNAGLPTDRQATRALEPCTVTTCITVAEATAADLAASSSIDAHGLAWQAHAGGVMHSCRIDLAVEVPAVDRPAVMAHEFGHCLGLPHWEHAGSAMSITHQERPVMPSALDLAWIGGAA